MKAPLSWLKEYVDIDCSIEELENKLFSCGFEVEDIEYFGEKINKIVFCKVLKIEQHPNADKLSVTHVDAGKYGNLQIITSAKNIFEGAIVPVAVDGATTFNGEQINTGELRGVLSEGMFCSGEELGINDDFYQGASVNGILIFNEEYPLGEEICDYLPIKDVIFDINVTANRPDCQSILGLAREVAAVLDKPFKMPDLDFKTNSSLSTKKEVKVFKNDELCPRYISHLVKNIKIEDSPLWIKRRLFSMGIRSINNIVDITNYVLTEIGQPMHAFDLNDLEENTVIIRRANSGEKITTLDEKVFELTSNNLVICDGVKPVALAGIMGGLNSEIKNITKDVLFESATFKRDNIRKSSRALGQKSDSSSRYEKGVDIFSPEIGMKRALNLIYTLKAGDIACDEYDLYDGEIKNKVLNTTFDKVNGVLGIVVPNEEIVSILKKLNFGVNVSGNNLEITVPLYREDVDDYPDIAEEVIREYGYDKLVPTLLKTSQITSGGLNDDQVKINELKNTLVGFGFNEIITYSFVNEKEYELFDFNKKFDLIKILNPLSEDMAVMRASLVPSVVRIACANINRKNFDGRLFEFAKTYVPSQNENTLPNEMNKLALSVFGENEDFFTLKGVIEELLNAFCFDKKVSYVACDYKFMHPTRSAFIKIGDKVVGFMGQVNPQISESLDAEKPVYVAEIDYETLKNQFNDKILFKNVSKFPNIERDLAILLDDNIAYAKVYDAIKESAGEYLEKITLFDVYKGDRISQGKKSMAFNLIFSANDRTLNVQEIDSAISNILQNLKVKLNAELR